MLHLKTHKFSHHHSNSPAGLHLSPVPSDDDELIQAIEADTDVWQLEAVPDTNALDQFWTGVEDDLKHDPSWFTFASDDDE